MNVILDNEYCEICFWITLSHKESKELQDRNYVGDFIRLRM